MKPLKLVVFASGTGTNAKNIFETAVKYPALLSVKGLICNKKNAGVLELARAYSFPSFVIPVLNNKDSHQARLDHENRITALLDTIDFDYICLAGYMRIFTLSFIERYPHPSWPVSKIINIHPSLLPSFKGLSAYEAAFEYGVRLAGVTAHFVNEELDGGMILHQRHFPRLPQDSLEDFKRRGLLEEHQCYRDALLALAKKEYQLQSNPFRLFLSISKDR